LPDGSVDAEGNIALKVNQAAILPARLRVVQSLSLANNASLTAANGAAILLVLDSLAVSNNAELGTSGGDLAIIVFGDTQIDLENNVQARLALVAPQAELTILSNNVHFEGALDVAALRMANNNRVTIQAPGVRKTVAEICGH
jgi:hypothetical protein